MPNQMPDKRTEVQVPLHIASDHPSLAGHFPGQPIVPGVVLLDHVFSILEQQDWLKDQISMTDGFEIPACKFLAPVLPGASLVLTLKLENANGTVSFRLEQAEQLVSTGSIKVTARHDSKQS
jgi:3-hydroxymyristoyl/3-hydroxydecanoyl-(acyl carrier protein) dehydratase